MTKIISIANQKGGVGKTTTAVNFSAGLAVAERKTLLIDLDPQGNASSGVGFFRNQVEKSIYDVFIGEAQLHEVILPTSLKFLSVIPSNQDLIGFEVEFIQQQGRELLLKKVLENLSPEFEYVVIDCPPSLGLLTLNSLTASQSVLVPLQCEYYALEGLSALLNTLELVRKNLNPTLALEGIVLTMFDPRNNLSKQVAEDVGKHFQGVVFHAVIPRNVRLSESPSYGKPVLLYDVHSAGAKSYLDLTKEFLARQVGLREPISEFLVIPPQNNPIEGKRVVPRM